MINLREIIERHVLLSPIPTRNGWYAILCPVCGDHGKKGARAAFRFDTDFDCSYNCFNCGHTAGFKHDQQQSVSGAMETVFTSFNIPDTEWGGLHLQVLSNTGQHSRTGHDVSPGKRSSIEPAILKIPSHFYKLSDADPEDDPVVWLARDYLQNDRGINPDSYPFYLSTGVSELPHEQYTSAKWAYRVIHPIYNRHNELVFYQGRALIDMPKKYESPSNPKNNILYGFDEIYKRSEFPLYVLEGFYDAYMINGCATLGNKLRPEQIEHLNKSQRQKVLIPDLLGDGEAMAHQALNEGWDVSIPDIPGCKDINDAVRRYGLLYVMKYFKYRIW